jgi:predicted RNase H-like nuclease (RuvC/YqgF family)
MNTEFDGVVREFQKLLNDRTQEIFGLESKIREQQAEIERLQRKAIPRPVTLYKDEKIEFDGTGVIYEWCEGQRGPCAVNHDKPDTGHWRAKASVPFKDYLALILDAEVDKRLERDKERLNRVREADSKTIHELLAKNDKINRELRDAWAATGLASTVQGMTTLADVIQTTKKHLTEATDCVDILMQAMTELSGKSLALQGIVLESMKKVDAIRYGDE